MGHLGARRGIVEGAGRMGAVFFVESVCEGRRRNWASSELDLGRIGRKLCVDSEYSTQSSIGWVLGAGISGFLSRDGQNTPGDGGPLKDQPRGTAAAGRENWH